MCIFYLVLGSFLRARIFITLCHSYHRGPDHNGLKMKQYLEIRRDGDPLSLVPHSDKFRTDDTDWY